MQTTYWLKPVALKATETRLKWIINRQCQNYHHGLEVFHHETQYIAG
jgi:hypothetical protein